MPEHENDRSYDGHVVTSGGPTGTARGSAVHSAFYDMTPARLRENLVDTVVTDTRPAHLAPMSWPIDSALGYAICNDDPDLLDRIIDSASEGAASVDIGHALGDDVEARKYSYFQKVPWQRNFLLHLLDECVAERAEKALPLLLRRVPAVRETLVRHAGQWLPEAVGRQNVWLLRTLIQAGFPEKNAGDDNQWEMVDGAEGDDNKQGWPYVLTKLSEETCCGSVFSQLVQMGAEPFAEEAGDLNTLHRRSLEGSSDGDIFVAAKNHGMSLDSLTRGQNPHRSIGESQPRYTPLDLAAQAKNITTMRILLRNQANPGGSFAISALEDNKRETGNGSDTQSMTTPLHELFESPGRYHEPDPDKFWLHKGPWRTLIALPEYHGLPGQAQAAYRDEKYLARFLCARSRDHRESPEESQGALVENPLAYAAVVRNGVRLLLQYGGGVSATVNLPDRGTPLECFLTFAYHIREQLDSGCSKDGLRLVHTLAEICDLLFDAGSYIPDDILECAQVEYSIGYIRLLRLINFYS